MPVTEEAVYRHLPALFRKRGRVQGGSETVIWSLTSTLASSLMQVSQDARQMLLAHYLETCGDLPSLQRLAALHQLERWPEESLDSFRRRIWTMAPVYLSGAANAYRLLLLIAAVQDAQLVKDESGREAVLLPDQKGSWPAVTPERFETNSYTTFALMRAQHDSSAVIKAAVVDLPRVACTAHFTGGETTMWTVKNDVYKDPVAQTGPDPVVTITAGATPLALPVLVQQDRRRMVLVNRIVNPHGKLVVDLVNRSVRHDAGDADVSSLTLDGGLPAPDLLYATAGLIGSTGDALSGLTKPPFHVLRWYPEASLTNDPAHDAPGPAGSRAPAPEKLFWPTLLTPGKSNWRLLVCEDRNGSPAFHLPDLRPVPPTKGPAAIDFDWKGRQMGAFTLVFDQADSLPKHRGAWLTEQVNRLKLAGIQYIPTNETAEKPNDSVLNGG